MKIISKGRRLLLFVLAFAMLLTMLPPLSLPARSDGLVDSLASNSDPVDYGANIGAVAQWNAVSSVLLASNHYESKGDVCGGVAVRLLPGKLAIVDYAYDEVSAVLWYKVDAAPGYTWPEEYANYHWVDAYTIRIVAQNGMTGVFDAERNPVTEVTVSSTNAVTVKAETSLQSADIDYQWQICYDTVNNLWVDITGKNSAEITITAGMIVSLMDENNQARVRCVTTVGTKSVTTDPVAVTFQLNHDVAKDTPAVYNRMPRNTYSPSSDSGVATAAETTTTYKVILQYLDENGENVVADPYTSVVSPSTILTNTISFPRVIGYEPHVYKDGNWVRQDTYTFDGKPFTGDFTLEVRYFPGSVDYKVNIYIQNAENDEYTLMESYVDQELTGTVLDEITIEIPGYYQSKFSSNHAAIAADGSTEFNLYYDRFYYLMKFDLDGGFGVYPIYARHGAKLEILNPTKAGYVFVGWDQTEGTPAVSNETLNDDIANTMYEYMPIGNTAYKAIWKMEENAKVTIVYWGQDPNNLNKYDYKESVEIYAKVGSTLTFGTNQLVCTLKPHAHGAGCTYNCGKTPHAHSLDNNCYTLNCNTTSHNHAQSGCTLNCEHQEHELSCYSTTTLRTLRQTTKPSDLTANSGNGIYTYRNGNTTYYYLYLNGTWYCAYGSISGNKADNQRITLSCTHGHTDVCYSCGLNDGPHVHSVEQGCYNLICQDEVHIHTADCYSCIAHEHTNSCSLNTPTGEAYDPKLWTLNTDKLKSVTVAPDGSTIMNVYYDRTTVTIHFRKSGSNSDDYGSITDKWGANIEDEFELICEKAGGQSWSEQKQADFPLTNHLVIMPHEERFYYHYTGSGSKIWVMTYYRESLTSGEYEVAFTVELRRSNTTYVSEEEYIELEGFIINHDLSTDKEKPTDGAKFYYDRADYQVEFNNGAGVVKTSKVLYEANLGAYDFIPTAPSRYEAGSVQFAGWYQNPECTGDEVKLDETTMPSENMILYAKWVSVKHDVTVYRYRDADGKLHDLLCNHTDEEIGGVQPLGSVSHGELLNKHYIPEKPEDEKYTFVTWAYYDKEAGKEIAIDINSFVVTKDVEIYAKWSSNVQIPYTIKYMIDGTDIEIAEPSEGKHYAGETHTFNAKTAGQLYADYQTGYFPTITSHSIGFETEADSYEFIFYYVKKDAVPYTVYYVTDQQNENNSLAEIKLTENGEEKTYYIVADTKQVGDNTNAIVTENFKTVSGYMPDAYQKTLIIDGSDGANNQIVFKYNVDIQHAYYKVTHYTQQIDGTWFAHASQEAVGTIGETISVNQMDIKGFTYYETTYTVGENAPTNTNSALTADGLEINLYYNRNKYSYTVQYILQGSTENTVLYTETFKDENAQYYGATVYHEAPEYYGTGNIYKRVSAEKLSTVIQTEVTNNVITFYYVEQEVTIKYEVANGFGGMVNPSQETVLIKSEDATGSVAAPLSSTYKFVGWYDQNGTLLSTEAEFVPQKDVNGLNVTATYYAKFEYNLTTLTIHVDGCNDLDQAFIFRVTGNGGVNLRVIAMKDDPVTIHGLTIGESYTVTMESWPWRYDVNDITSYKNMSGSTNVNSKSITVTLGLNGEVTFNVAVNDNWWLDGNSPRGN